VAIVSRNGKDEKSVQCAEETEGERLMIVGGVLWVLFGGRGTPPRMAVA